MSAEFSIVVTKPDGGAFTPKDGEHNTLAAAKERARELVRLESSDELPSAASVFWGHRVIWRAWVNRDNEVVGESCTGY